MDDRNSFSQKTQEVLQVTNLPSIYTPLPETLTTIEQFTILGYGASGTGKTRAIAQIPGCCFLSCDPGKYGGLISAVDIKPAPVQIRLNTWSDYLRILPQIEKDAGTVFTTLVLDPVNEFVRMILQNILSLSGRELARFEDWNLCMERLRSAIRKLSSFNCNFIMLCTEQMTKDETLGKLFGLPNVPGKLAQELPAAVDIVLHFFTKSGYGNDGKKKVTYLFQSQPDEIWTAKDRFNIFKPEEVVPFNGAINLFKPLLGKEVKV